MRQAYLISSVVADVDSPCLPLSTAPLNPLPSQLLLNPIRISSSPHACPKVYDRGLIELDVKQGQN